jgi:diaminopimelate decarboxylase
MFYDAHHETDNISNPDGDRKIYNVVGYICESDTFATDRLLNEVRKDDFLAFRNAGAYCYSMASNYNTRMRPAEVMVLKGQDYLIRTEETIEDLTRNLVDPEIEFGNE